MPRDPRRKRPVRARFPANVRLRAGSQRSEAAGRGRDRVNARQTEPRRRGTAPPLPRPPGGPDGPGPPGLPADTASLAAMTRPSTGTRCPVSIEAPLPLPPEPMPSRLRPNHLSPTRHLDHGEHHRRRRCPSEHFGIVRAWRMPSLGRSHLRIDRLTSGLATCRALGSNRWTVSTVVKRLERERRSWKRIGARAQTLTAAERRLDDALGEVHLEVKT